MGLKRTKIEYKKLDSGDILIVGIENAATGKKIKAEYGPEVSRGYSNTYPHYKRAITFGTPVITSRHNDVPTVYLYERKGNITTITAGVVLPKVVFERVIGLMKASGRNLGWVIAKVRREQEESKVHTVII